MAENDGTTAEGTTEAPETGTPVKDEVTLFKSRIAGLDAKVTELQRAEAAAKALADEAKSKLAAYEAGTVGADEALRAQIAAKDAEIATARREAAAAKAAAKYPETYAVFGDDIAGMSEDKLAASEARLSGVAPVEEPPTPRGTSGARTPGVGSGQEAKPPTKSEIEERIGREFAKLIGR